MTAFVYGPGALGLIVGGVSPNPIDFLSNTIQLGLSNSTHVPNRDDVFIDDVGADDFVDGELSGTGYSRKTLANKTLTYDATNDLVEFDADDVTFTAINAGTMAQATVFQQTGGADNARRLICNIDSGGFPVASNGGDVTLRFSSGGLLQLTV